MLHTSGRSERPAADRWNTRDSACPPDYGCGARIAPSDLRVDNGGMELLDDTTIDAKLDALPGWQREGAEITRTFRLPTFPDAIAFVDRVAILAEDADHHPDIDVRWREVRTALSTHSAGGLTERDFSLATRIDGVVDPGS